MYNYIKIKKCKICNIDKGSRNFNKKNKKLKDICKSCDNKKLDTFSFIIKNINKTNIICSKCNKYNNINDYSKYNRYRKYKICNFCITKKCVKCKEDKLLNNFHIKKCCKLGVRNLCIECRSINDKNMRIEYNCKYKNSKELKKCNKCNEKKSMKDFQLFRNKCNNCYSLDNYNDKYKKYQKKYKKHKYNNNIEYKIQCNIRSSIKNSLNMGEKGNLNTCDILECSYEFFYNWIEFNCILDELDISKIHIDHIYPQSKYKNNKWTNLFPLNPKDNIIKSDKEPTKEYLSKVNNRIRMFLENNLFNFKIENYIN